MTPMNGTSSQAVTGLSQPYLSPLLSQLWQWEERRKKDEEEDDRLVNIWIFHSIPFSERSAFQGCYLVSDKFPSLGQMEVIHPSCPRVLALVRAVTMAVIPPRRSVLNARFCHAAEPNCFLPQERRRWDLLCGATLGVSANYWGCFCTD